MLHAYLRALAHALQQPLQGRIDGSGSAEKSRGEVYMQRKIFPFAKGEGMGYTRRNIKQMITVFQQEDLTEAFEPATRTAYQHEMQADQGLLVTGQEAELFCGDG